MNFWPKNCLCFCCVWMKWVEVTKFSNLSSEEWLALKSLRKKHCYQSDRQRRHFRCLADKPLPKRSNFLTPFFQKVHKGLNSINQNTVKNTINELIAKQELPAFAKNLIITTPRTPFSHKNPTHNPQFLHSPWGRANARNISFLTCYSGQFTFST